MRQRTRGVGDKIVGGALLSSPHAQEGSVVGTVSRGGDSHRRNSDGYDRGHKDTEDFPEPSLGHRDFITCQVRVAPPSPDYLRPPRRPAPPFLRGAHAYITCCHAPDRPALPFCAGRMRT